MGVSKMKNFKITMLVHGCLVVESDDGQVAPVEALGGWGNPAPAPKPAMPMPPMAPHYPQAPMNPINYAFSTIAEATDFIRTKVESEAVA
jgi:hypothetical protein